MKPDQEWKFRLAVLAELVKRAPQPPGRTALMKFVYLLQICRTLPLGYDFRMYSYGPYDISVLSDLSYAETLKMVRSRTVRYPSGNIGYQYSPHKAYLAPTRRENTNLVKYEPDLAWLLEHFSDRSAAELELISTIVFADQEMRRKSDAVCQQELCRRVKAIKPHFDETTINHNIDRLQKLDLLGRFTTAES